jgi:hypothetical protein
VKDLREYARQTTIQLIVGGVILLLVVGEGLIYMFYGIGGAITGLMCIGGGLIPVVLIIAILYLMEWIVKRNDK